MSLVQVIKASIERRRILRELRSFDKAESHDAYWDFRHSMQAALEAYEMEHLRRSVEIWEHAYARFPDEALTSPLALVLLLKLRLYDLAETLMTKGRKRYPGQPGYLEGLARVASERGNHEEAVRLSKILCKRHPGFAAGYGIAASSLGSLGRAKEAEAIMQAGLKALPEELGLRLEYARIAGRRGDWAEALLRWTDVHEKFGHIVGTIGLAAALKELGRYDEADAVLSSVAHKHGTEYLLWTESADIAERKGDWVEALRRWAIVRKRFPVAAVGYVKGLRAFRELGREQEAEQVLREGVANVHEDPAPLVEYAWLAHRRGDWEAAAERWASVRHNWPNQRDGYEAGAEALVALGQPAEAAIIRSKQTK